MKTTSKLAAIAGAAITALGVTAGPAQAAAHHVVKADPGTGTISAAVAKAHPGDTIKLSAGTYHDSVFIPISLTIDGAGWSKTILMPPATSDSPCNMDGMEGLCAAGAFDAQGNPDITKPVVDVTIRDLRVTGFSDTGVLGFNTRDMRVTHVKADHNTGYGIARFVSTDTVFDHNWTSYNGEAGLYMGDSPHADSVVRNNRADHNGIGVFLRDSTDITTTGNRVWDNCVGIFALNSGAEAAPGDLPAGDYTIKNNRAWDNDKACPGGEHPPLSGIGIGLLGVHDTVVTGNVVNANHPTGDTLGAGGIVIASTKSLGGADPTNNTVRHNHLAKNQPADIVWDGSGSGNKISKNKCTTTLPPNNPRWCMGDDH
jgi:parallel beta-helix repeat protein